MVGILLVFYLLSIIICILYIRYDKEDTDTTRKIIMGMMWIPIINMGYALYIIVDTLMTFLKTEKLYNFIRKGRNGSGRV